MNLSSILSKISNTIILSLSFIGFLIWIQLKDGVFSFFLTALSILIVSAVSFAFLKKEPIPKKIEEPGPVIIIEPISEDKMFEELANVMTDYNLELRLRRIEDGWNVTLLHHRTGITRLVGVGSGKCISDALVKAEADFLEKTGN